MSFHLPAAHSRCKEAVQEHSPEHHGPTVGGRQEAERCEYCCSEGHVKELEAGADEDAEREGVGWRREDVAVHKRPATLLFIDRPLLVSQRFHVVAAQVVAADVPVDRSHEDHANEARQEHDDDYRVEDADPVDLVADCSIHR